MRPQRLRIITISFSLALQTVAIHFTADGMAVNAPNRKSLFF
jgi:hypothetical protein